MILSLLILIPFITSLDEELFLSEVHPCICATDNNSCNPYCACDPLCTDEQKQHFTFHLPERFGSNKISCDPDNNIDKTNLDSIHTVEINGVTCYVIDNDDSGEKIINYTPEDFGLDTFISPAEIPDTIPESFNDSIATVYKDNDHLYVSYTDYEKDTGFLFVPIGIGSSICNAAIPVLVNHSLPQYKCLLPKNVDISNLAYELLFVKVNDRTGQNIPTPGYEGLFEDFIFSKSNVLSLRYTFQYEDNNITYYKINLEPISRQNYNLAVVQTQVFFSNQVSTHQDIEYEIKYMGYYYGVPIMAASEVIDTFIKQSRTALLVGTDDFAVPFGVKSTYVINIEKIPNDMIQTDGYVNFISNITSDDYPDNYQYGIKLQAMLNPSIIKEDNGRISFIEPHIYRSYGIAYDPTIPYHRIDMELCPINDSNCTNSACCKIIKDTTASSTWTFYYSKYNNDQQPIYLLQNGKVNITLPGDWNTTWYSNRIEKVIINTVFVEVDYNGNPIIPEEVEFYSGKLSMVFDVFFRSNQDALKTIGIFFCFALLGTIWCWYMCFFYIE